VSNRTGIQAARPGPTGASLPKFDQGHGWPLVAGPSPCNEAGRCVLPAHSGFSSKGSRTPQVPVSAALIIFREHGPTVRC